MDEMIRVGVWWVERYWGGVVEDGEIVGECMKWKRCVVEGKVDVVRDKVVVKVREWEMVSWIRVVEEEWECEGSVVVVWEGGFVVVDGDC